MLQEVIGHPVALLFLVIALGSGLGKIQVAGISLGSSGVLFTGLLFGHLGVALPVEIQELGIILFVYAVGLQAGPRFFNQFRERGIIFAKIGLVVVLSGAAVTWLVTRIFELDAALAIGMYAGALTSTPGLAGATDAARDPTVGVGFGVAYPFGVIGVVLLVQLLPRILGISLSEEEARLKARPGEGELLRRRQYRVSNPACVNRSLSQLQLRNISQVTITRLAREGNVQPAHQDIPLQLGDILVAVGRTEELDKLRLLIGEEVDSEEIYETPRVMARDVVVSSGKMVGKALSELRVQQNFGVTISRVFREDLDFTPSGSYVMELGDVIRVTGNRDDVSRFVEAAGQQEKRIHETSIAALSVGIFLGVLLAYKEFVLPGGASFRLGLAGGPLMVSLVLAHFGRIGRFNVRIPRGAKYVLQQLGLVLFLAAAGTAAGTTMGDVLAESGPSLLLAGAIITLSSASVGFIVTRYRFKQDFLTVLGAMSGAMTSTPALGVVSEISSRNEATLAYTGVYPVALIVITVVSQFLYFFL